MDSVKHLLPQVKKYFKTNLHTHSTISDGKLTPEKYQEIVGEAYPVEEGQADAE
jgi:hypothetical protein